MGRNDCFGVHGGRGEFCGLQVLSSRSTGKPVAALVRRNRNLVRTRFRGALAGASPMVAPAITPAATSQPQAGTPAWLQWAYDLSALSASGGAGQTVGIVDEYGDTTAASDLATYRSYFGLPACTTSNGCLTITNDLGQSSPLPPQGTGSNANWQTETTLDLEAVSALCPLCKIILVQVTPSDSPEAADAEAATLGATVISDSWGQPWESDWGNPGITDPGATGDPVLLASGDQGYDGTDDGVTYFDLPDNYSDDTSVGGTELTSDPSVARGFDETTWDGASSGCAYVSGWSGTDEPAWQDSLDTGCEGRAYTDLSADADPETGLDVYSTQFGGSGWEAVGGTSLAAPLTASYYALMNQAGVSGLNSSQWPYSNAAYLNDITSGDNDDLVYGNYRCASGETIMCDAGIGWDGPTGNGAISGDSVPGAPGIGSNGTETSGTQSSATISGGVYSNQEATQAYIQYGTTTNYGSQTSATSVAETDGASAYQTTITGLSANTTYDYRIVASNSDGTTYGYNETFTTGDGPPIDAAANASPASGTSTSTVSEGFAGTVNDQNGADGSWYIEWGLTSAYGNTTAPQAFSGDSDESASLTLSGLQPDTTYHYQLVEQNANGSDSTGDLTFTTASLPTVSACSTPTVTTSDMYCDVTVDTYGEPDASYVVEYGATSAYGETTSAVSLSGAASQPITPEISSGLTQGSTYHYAILLSTEYGEALTADGSFTVPVAPTIWLDGVTNVSSTSATLDGTVNAGSASAEALFYLSTSPSMQNVVDEGYTVIPASSGSQPITASVANLQPNTTYYYELSISNAVGYVTTDVASFTTSAPPAPAPTTPVSTPPSSGEGGGGVGPVLQSSSVTMSAVGEVTISAIVSGGDASTTVTVSYGTSRSALNRTVKLSRGSVALAGLKADTTYYYTVTVGNQTSQVKSFTTPSLASLKKRLVKRGQVQLTFACAGKTACTIRTQLRVSAGNTQKVVRTVSVTVAPRTSRTITIRSTDILSHRLHASLLIDQIAGRQQLYLTGFAA
ncbi:MAG TPA: hypothetical protein VME01_05525 [Solirubrobacteraceae bacterium]|nr:hypothetical protein [Solirubrobacteraceae bacterium]